MTQLSWGQKAGCFYGALKPGEERPELFAKSWLGLWAVYWRVPIFIWSLITITWSTASFWGSVNKYMLYMTHWGLLLILVESFFGVIVALKEDRFLPGIVLLFCFFLYFKWCSSSRFEVNDQFVIFSYLFID